eukprot:CAMPEP_0173261428 /NCGR_PEP_ID=MMETSP1142-20121109/26175_1 /TAXON_ID=483371 /ORGANISM="non described non described, Strain CCMP2298" /LENGTH=78 /DNA_ID=CAMNT_0014196377 /DNA_START=134 /DNA_END=370 /DNA_ORIENTATION=+
MSSLPPLLMIRSRPGSDLSGLSDVQGEVGYGQVRAGGEHHGTCEGQHGVQGAVEGGSGDSALSCYQQSRILQSEGGDD